MDYTILVGGEAGQGMDTFSNLMEKILKRHGFFVFTHSDYMSRVRGGHNYFLIRFSDKPVYTFSNKVDIIFGMNKETIELHEKKLAKDGIIICDANIEGGGKTKALPLSDEAKKLKNPKVSSTIGLAAILNYLGLSLEIAEAVLAERFKDTVLEVNLKALNAGKKLIEKKYDLKPMEDKKIVINGNQAVGLGAVAAGCKYYCAYPMTPSTGVFSYISKKASEMEIITDQVEDEVASLNMALGASFAGLRAMTGSSGGGLALMAESLSFAGIVELPVVIVNVQRPGPATGLATRTEQSDLKFIINGGHGEFPKMVISLRNPEDAFYQTIRAFDLADKYRIPVILMSDQALADSNITTEPFNFEDIKINRYFNFENNSDEKFKTYELTENGISPRIIPGRYENKLMMVDSDEHDEYGHTIEDGEMRVKMVDKRATKMLHLEKELQEPWLIGEDNPDNLIVCWGSLYGAVREAVERLVDEGVSIGALVFGDIWPLPKEKLSQLAPKAKKLIDIEQNSTGQLDSIIREQLLIKSDYKLLKYDGRAFNGEEIYDRLKGEVL